MPSADRTQPPQANIADQYRDLLGQLDENRRRGVVQQLADGYYQGWRPSRAELAKLISRGAGGDGPIQPSVHPVAAQPRRRETTAGASAQKHQRPSSVRPKIQSGGPAHSAPALPVLASFSVDCGELVQHFRFVATSLTHDDTTVRDRTLCRIIWLNYELIPLPSMPGGHQIAAPPVIFSGPILCLSDTRAQNHQDGRRRQHSLNNGSVSGSRGAWPLIMTTRQMRFLIGPNPPATGLKARQQPVGTLVVEIGTGGAQWHPRV